MELDSQWLIVFLALFIRVSAMLLAAPLTATAVPVNIRVLISAALAFALAPTVQPMFGSPPESVIELILLGMREALTGLLIGFCLKLAASAAEMAGGIADLQIGLMSAQIMSPVLGSAATPTSRLKMMLGLALLFASDAHHLMIQALVKSYNVGGLTLQGLEPAHTGLLSIFSQVMLLSLQIAAPVAAVGIVVDMAAGFVNKAVPQTQPFLLALPAKLALGLVALSLGLPALAAGMRHATDASFQALSQMLGG